MPNEYIGSNQSVDYKVSDKKSYSDTINNNLTRFMNGHVTTELHRTENHSTIESRIYPLYIIYSNSTLELRDCKLLSKNTEAYSQSAQDVCFYLRQTHTSILKEADLHPTLIIQSTFITNFYTVIQNSLLGKIYLEKLYVSKSRGHALNISNPFILEIKESVIESTAKSCINIRFSKEMVSDAERTVIIKKNEFSYGQTYAISIFGENIISQMCSIVISENKVHGFQKDGIGFKNLNINGISLESNEIFNNAGNGVCIHGVVDTKSFSQVRLSGNKITQSKLYGLTLIDSSVYSENDEIFQNSKGGVILSAAEKIKNLQEFTFYKNYPVRNIFNSTKILNNGDSGLTIVGFMKGPLILNFCQISDNVNGIYVKQTPISLFDKSDNEKVQAMSQGFGDIVLKECNVSCNTSSGIYVKSVTNKLYMKGGSVHGNKNFAVYLESQEDINHLEFQKEGKGKARENVSGYIGGSWGILYENNYSKCKPGKCEIF